MNLHDSVHVGDVVQNINAANECPSCKTANVPVFSCMESNCSERWCTYCGTKKPGSCQSCIAERNRQRIAREKLAQVERQEAQARDRKERLEAEERNRKRDRLEELSRRREELAYQIRRDSVRRTGLMATSEELGKQNLKEFFLLLAAAPILLVLAFTLWLYVYDFWATTSLCGFIWVAFWIQLKFRRYIDHKRSIPRWDREYTRKVSKGEKELHSVENALQSEFPKEWEMRISNEADLE